MALYNSSNNTNIKWISDPRLDAGILDNPNEDEIESRIHTNLKIPIKTEHLTKKSNHRIALRFINHKGRPYSYITVIIPEFNVQQMTNKNGEIFFTVRESQSKYARGTLYSGRDVLLHSKHKHDFEILVSRRQNFTYRLDLHSTFYKANPPKGAPHKDIW